MTDEDRKELADLALRALDTINEDYGEDAELIAACLTFEVASRDDDGELAYYGNQKILERNSPLHIAGVLQAAVNELLNPVAADD